MFNSGLIRNDDDDDDKITMNNVAINIRKVSSTTASLALGNKL